MELNDLPSVAAMHQHKNPDQKRNERRMQEFITDDMIHPDEPAPQHRSPSLLNDTASTVVFEAGIDTPQMSRDCIIAIYEKILGGNPETELKNLFA